MAKSDYEKLADAYGKHSAGIKRFMQGLWFHWNQMADDGMPSVNETRSVLLNGFFAGGRMPELANEIQYREIDFVGVPAGMNRAQYLSSTGSDELICHGAWPTVFNTASYVEGALVMRAQVVGEQVEASMWNACGALRRLLIGADIIHGDLRIRSHGTLGALLDLQSVPDVVARRVGYGTLDAAQKLVRLNNRRAEAYSLMPPGTPKGWRVVDIRREHMAVDRFIGLLGSVRANP